MSAAFSRSNVIMGLLLGWALSGQSARADQISTLSVIPTDPQFVPSVVVTNTADAAQVITAPNEPGVKLTSFQLELGSAGTVSLQFRAAVYQFDPVNFDVVGSPLYTSATATAQPIGINQNYQLFTFSPGNLSLSPGNTFVLLMQQDGMSNTTNYQFPITPTSLGDVYTAGEAIEIEANTAFPNLSGDPTADLNHADPTLDLAFSASFANPEPSFSALLVPTIGLARMRRRRTARTQTHGRRRAAQSDGIAPE